MASVSERALAKVKEVPKTERPISEQFRVVAKQWVDAHAAASLMEELKSTTLAKIKTNVMAQSEKCSEAKAEREARCSPQWEDYLRQMCDHRAKANKLKVQLEYLRMVGWESNSKEANARHELRLG